MSLKWFWNLFFTQTLENMATAHDGEDLKIEKETLSVPMREKRKPALPAIFFFYLPSLSS